MDVHSPGSKRRQDYEPTGGVTISTGRMEDGEATMELLVEQVEVWVAGIPDKPGGLAGSLAPLCDVGADLQLIIARRNPDKPGDGVVFVTPLQGDREIVAAALVGFNVTQTLHCVRVMGINQPGIASALTEKLAKANLNLRGFSASVIGTQFVAYVAVDSQAEANKVVEVLQAA